MTQSLPLSAQPTQSLPLYWPLSDHIQERIKDWEGLALEAYRCPAGVWTIGWGATGRGIFKGVKWTLAQCEKRWQEDLWEMALAVTQLLQPTTSNRAPHTTQREFEALVSFAYNLGPDIDEDHIAEGLGDSTLLKLHLAGNYRAAAGQFLKWNKARVNGKLQVLKGLDRRRKEEAEWYLS